jgi:hypothetical protein
MNLSVMLAYFITGILSILFFGLHVWIFAVNKYIYGLLVCTFIVLYAIAIMILVFRNRGCFKDSSLSLMTYMSFYVIALHSFMMIYIIYRLFVPIVKK